MRWPAGWEPTTSGRRAARGSWSRGSRRAGVGGAVAGVLGAVVALRANALAGGVGADDLRAAVVEGLLFAVLSPVGVAVAAGGYLLSIRTFIGSVAGSPPAART